ncbi:hypothetical protein [Vibrio sagamiensis]|uniref:Uncharacterized protein n=1 Tax=Vibrio sagamiensis NBRC 104589 TaxID=1219064 RepID=A0A511QK29_9VIBR|nr:hypothetical protein [Vibrio sagamiensis]GEM77547.1 hypothetical protein VSA01S_36590 [Vibrio sagamiensis NBRC 104589]
MNSLTDIFLSIDFLKFSVPLFGAVIAWFLNESRKRIWEQYYRKEESYKELLRCLEGFHENADPTEARHLKTKFLSEVNKCWLYCPDDVIKKIYNFLELSKKNTFNTEEERETNRDAIEDAVGVIIASVRKDLLSRKLVKKTKLSDKDFNIYKAR